MSGFNTLAELFKHIQENIKTPSYLKYRNNEEWVIVRHETVFKYKKENRTASVEGMS